MNKSKLFCLTVTFLLSVSTQTRSQEATTSDEGGILRSLFSSVLILRNLSKNERATEKSRRSSSKLAVLSDWNPVQGLKVAALNSVDKSSLKIKPRISVDIYHITRAGSSKDEKISTNQLEEFVKQGNPVVYSYQKKTKLPPNTHWISERTRDRAVNLSREKWTETVVFDFDFSDVQSTWGTPNIEWRFERFVKGDTENKFYRDTGWKSRSAGIRIDTQNAAYLHPAKGASWVLSVRRANSQEKPIPWKFRLR